MKGSSTMNETGSAVASRKRIADKSRAATQSKAGNNGNGGAAANGAGLHDAKAILEALTALKQGDSSVRLPIEWTGMQGKVAETFKRYGVHSTRYGGKSVYRDVLAQLKAIENRYGVDLNTSGENSMYVVKGTWY